MVILATVCGKEVQTLFQKLLHSANLNLFCGAAGKEWWHFNIVTHTVAQFSFTYKRSYNRPPY